MELVTKVISSKLRKTAEEKKGKKKDKSPVSPKIPRTFRVNEHQFFLLSERAVYDHSQCGYLHKRSSESSKWQLRWFVLYQNMLFYYNSQNCNKPSGVVLLEGCYCERLLTPEYLSRYDKQKKKLFDYFQESSSSFIEPSFAISYRKDNLKHYELRALNETECTNWIEAIRDASFNKILMQKEELEQKHLHLLQILESEKTSKWHYTQQCEELVVEVKKLRAELVALKKQYQALQSQSTWTFSSNDGAGCSNLYLKFDQNTIELHKIKKVQSFFRGWLCRRRWKQIVEQYIRSPHAESMRKRNSLVFRMVENEEEYMEQMEVLVSCFFRPFKMAASSKKPPCTHDDVNSIFLNSETVLFLHQIFLKGLTSRLENWPTLILGDLFSMLLPMLNIYQEYVRNHHYSLQVLTECKQSVGFTNLLKRLENKPLCRGRSLESFLTYPMHQVPRYIVTLHELLAHTPHDHVERTSLQNAKEELEILSRQMHDEVSETENLRKNLAVERMIAEGCDILLDINQVFVRQGTLIQLPSDTLKLPKGKLSFKSGKECIRQCFLFSNHFIISTRTSGGKLHLAPIIGKIALSDALLIEDPSSVEPEPPSSPTPGPSSPAAGNPSGLPPNAHNRDFKIIVELKDSDEYQVCVHLMAPTAEEKSAWVSDISQCLDNVQYNDLLRPPITSTSLVTIPQSIKNDPKLFKDEADIRFSRTLNSCKIPQIRYATPEKLLQRLTDLRFISIDFLNTFLLTYRIFTDGVTVLNALRKVFYNPEGEQQGSLVSLDPPKDNENTVHHCQSRRRSSVSPRRTSGASSVSGYGSEPSERDRSHSYDSQGHRHWKTTLHKYKRSLPLFQDEEESRERLRPPGHKTSPLKHVKEQETSLGSRHVSITVEESSQENNNLSIPKVTASTSSETLTDVTVISAPCSPSNLSSVTLVGSATSDTNGAEETKIEEDTKSESLTPTGPAMGPPPRAHHVKQEQEKKEEKKEKPVERSTSVETEQSEETSLLYTPAQRPSYSSSRSASISTSSFLQAYYASKKLSLPEEDEEEDEDNDKSSIESEIPLKPSKPGVVITSSRPARRRSSITNAALAFAIATSAASNPRDPSPPITRGRKGRRDTERSKFKDNAISTACTMRVLNVLRHWISKHAYDFDGDMRLKCMMMEFLEDIIYSPNLLPAEHKAAAQLVRLLAKDDLEKKREALLKLLNPPPLADKQLIETFSVLEIAEQLTFLDHHIFVSITSEEFLGQAWMKEDKSTRSPNIILMTKRFNDVSRLIASEILQTTSLSERVAVIEKWTSVADIARCLHNYNGVLQICSAFTTSAVYRLKKTWEKVSKSSKQTIEKLQVIVSSDGRFRYLRDTLHRCDPPCIPYLGIYLTDLSFIEEGTPNFTPDELLNFSKMRMIANVIREIRHFQQISYKIEVVPRVTSYLLDTSLLIDDDELYRLSLEMEPRTSRLNSTAGQLPLGKN